MVSLKERKYSEIVDRYRKKLTFILKMFYLISVYFVSFQFTHGFFPNSLHFDITEFLDILDGPGKDVHNKLVKSLPPRNFYNFAMPRESFSDYR